MDDLQKTSPAPVTPEPTVSQPVQPVSVHQAAASHWSMIVAAIGVPILAALVVGGLLLLPDQTQPTSPTGTAAGQHPGRPDGGSPAGTRTSAAAPMQLMTVQDASGRGALCNDGSPAKYYYRPGSGSGADKWIIFLQAGGECRDAATCADRVVTDYNLTSSTQLAATLREDGLFNPDPVKNPDFANWNAVKLSYCSSDGWNGDATQTVNGQTWYFRGKTIVSSVLADLEDPSIVSGDSLADATDVVFGGGSAGGEGAAQNLDDVAALLPDANVKGLIDSTWTFTIDPYISQGTADDYAATYAYQNKQLDDTCVAGHPDDPESCSTQSILYPYLSTPVFIYRNLRDATKLTGVGVTTPLDDAEKAWVTDTYVPAMLASFNIIADGLFAPDATFHTIATDPKWFTTAIDGHTAAEVFGNWFFGRSGPTRLVAGE